MKNLIILCAGGFGREMYMHALDAIGYKEHFVVKGFLDDNLNKLDGFTGYPPIIGNIKDYQPQPNDLFVCAVGDVKTKKRITELILSKGGKFLTLICKDVKIGPNVVIGEGTVILSGAHIHCDVKIGNHVTIQPLAILGHDVIVEDWCLINALADCGGASYLEEGATLHTTSFVLPLKRVGAYAVVGAGSVAARNVKPKTVVMGVPAKELILPSIPNVSQKKNL